MRARLRDNTRRRSGIKALLGLNAALLVLLGAVRFAPEADAQGRPRGEYLMLAGEVAGAKPQVVWILDQVHEEIVAVSWSRERGELVGLGFRSLAADSVQSTRGRN
ncbi:MAG: hypothetical protein ACO3SJ_08375 [Phycisphaerales bacterium]|jgi:hypothetical protein